MVIYSCTTAIEMVVKIAIRFAAMRQQFGKPNEDEISLLEYPLHQNRLFPIPTNTLNDCTGRGITAGISNRVDLSGLL